MRILVYGAGVIGSNLAADLYAAGKDVTLLARGAWADTLEERGLVIRSALSHRSRYYRIPVIRELGNEDIYDLIFVAVRYTQLDSVIPVLAKNQSENIVLIGNNLKTGECRRKLRGRHLLFAFSMAAGRRERDHVVSLSLRKMVIGRRKTGNINVKLIREIFSGTRIGVTCQPDMEDYLLCHAALVVPIAFACYACSGNLKKIRGSRVWLNRIIDANIEGYRAIENAGHRILPKSDRDFRSKKYRRRYYLFYQLMCASGLGKICASDHALGATEEMSALNEDLKRFFDAHRSNYPVYRKLERWAGNHINPKISMHSHNL